jgi:hypothetical protein
MRQLGQAKAVRQIPGVPLLYNLPRTSKIFIEKPPALALGEVKQVCEILTRLLLLFLFLFCFPLFLSFLPFVLSFFVCFVSLF